ncbi:olfactory receptor 51I2-like [Lethenteron reissneri]|uniref:olfactory receptor 51I2-like n=1 Tax=Lethenteron reissneri TaxID=7753 RepID=UPI002AB73C17|nr:olfactory receptor 51I2-like [Lethenteron reissneri]
MAATNISNLVSHDDSNLITITGLLRNPPSTRPLVFAVVLLIYIVVLAGNVLLCLIISREKRLHRPMYILLAGLALSDIAGSTATLPRIMTDLAASNRITLAECVAQMLAVHLYRALDCYILSAMALDRYAAICHPLRYPALVTNARTAAVLAAVATASAAIVSVILGLMLALKFDGCAKPKVLPGAYCDIMSLVNIACSDGVASNAYGVAVAVATVGTSLAVVAFSYARILYECGFGSERRDLLASRGHVKARRTCVSHILALTVFYAPLLFVITYNRVDKYVVLPDNVRSGLSCLFYVAPPALNPIIYGLRSGEIRRTAKRLFSLKPFSASSLRCSDNKRRTSAGRYFVLRHKEIDVEWLKTTLPLLLEQPPTPYARPNGMPPWPLKPPS